MAKLIKAATARNNAAKVDPLDLTMQSVIEAINYAVSHGEFANDVWVPTAQREDVTKVLEAAGYNVRERSTLFMEIPLSSESKSLWQRILDILRGTRVEVQSTPVPMRLDDEFALLEISWAKEPSTPLE